jgi:hypothetical protein
VTHTARFVPPSLHVTLALLGECHVAFGELERAIEDGVLVEVFTNRWAQLSAGKPIIATRHVFEALSLAALREIWNDYVVWAKEVKATLPEAEQLFTTTMNGETVWIIEDGAAHTIMYPKDY